MDSFWLNIVSAYSDVGYTSDLPPDWRYMAAYC